MALGCSHECCKTMKIIQVTKNNRAQANQAILTEVTTMSTIAQASNTQRIIVADFVRNCEREALQ